MVKRAHQTTSTAPGLACRYVFIPCRTFIQRRTCNRSNCHLLHTRLAKAHWLRQSFCRYSVSTTRSFEEEYVHSVERPKLCQCRLPSCVTTQFNVIPVPIRSQNAKPGRRNEPSVSSLSDSRLSDSPQHEVLPVQYTTESSFEGGALLCSVCRLKRTTNFPVCALPISTCLFLRSSGPPWYQLDTNRLSFFLQKLLKAYDASSDISKRSTPCEVRSPIFGVAR